MLSPSDFLGAWAIERWIEDARSGQSARFLGEAVIEPKDEDWVYAEHGTLELTTGAPMRAERRYIWRADETGFDIFFSDKRFFHRFDLDPCTQAQHWCDPDDYEVEYDLSNWPVWQSVWRVSGPRKCYVMTSRMSRAG